MAYCMRVSAVFEGLWLVKKVGCTPLYLVAPEGSPDYFYLFMPRFMADSSDLFF